MHARFRKALSILSMVIVSSVTRSEVSISVPPMSSQHKVKLDAIFTDFKQPSVPGCALGVYYNGKAHYTNGYGMADLAHNAPITPNTVFDIASISKQFTAISIGLLAKLGRLSLDDDIHQYIPELPDYAKKISIRQLLSHTSGLRDYVVMFDWHGTRFDDILTDDEVLEMVTRQSALDFEPGARFEYSSTGYFLTALIVKRRSGKSLREFADEHIFSPLNMKNTRFVDDYTEVVPNLAAGYSTNGGENWHFSQSRWLQIGPTRLHTSIKDLALWDHEFYHPTLFPQDLIDEIQLPMHLNDGTRTDYAQGVHVTQYKGHIIYEHGGRTDGYLSHYLRLPEERWSIAVLCNTDTSQPKQLAYSALDIMITKNLPKSPVPKLNEHRALNSNIPQTPPNALTGYFRDAAAYVYRSVVMEQDQLWYVSDGDKVKLISLGANRFAFEGRSEHSQLWAITDASNVVQRLERREADELLWAIERYQPWQPDPNQLQLYTGNYYSSDLDMHLNFTLESGKLVAHTRHNRHMNLTPTVTDQFFSDWIAELQFEHNGDDITQFRLNLTKGMRDVLFIKSPMQNDTTLLYSNGQFINKTQCNALRE